MFHFELALIVVGEHGQSMTGRREETGGRLQNRFFHDSMPVYLAPRLITNNQFNQNILNQ
jgi:hypothetical protein